LRNTEGTNSEIATWNRLYGQLMVGIQLYTEQNSLQVIPGNEQERHTSRDAEILTYYFRIKVRILIKIRR